MARVRKGVLSQGTNVWIKHGEPTAAILTKMICIKGIQLGDDTPTDIDNTCLEEEDSKTSVNGLNQPGEGSITLNTDPDNATHITLLKLADDNADVEIYIGWSDGKVVPTLEPLTGKVTLPEDRTWTSTTARLKAGAPTFEPDALVGHTISLKRQSKVITAYRTTP